MTDRLIGWQKLNRKCLKCGRPHADIVFRFHESGFLPGEREECYHLRCCPPRLKRLQEDMKEFAKRNAQTPP